MSHADAMDTLDSTGMLRKLGIPGDCLTSADLPEAIRLGL